MKKIVLVIMGLIFFFGSVSAYQVNIESPDTLSVGKPLIVTGTTTFGIGTPIDVVLSYQQTTSTEVRRKIVYVQSDKTFKVVFDTTDLKKGTYKVEVPVNGQGDSVTTRLVNLVDRSDEIYISSPTQQYYNGKLYVTGTLSSDVNSGFQIEVSDSNYASVFGPTYVNTNYLGVFSADIPLSGPGDYEVTFTDAKGYIGSRVFTVLGQETASAVTTIPTTMTVLSAHGRSSRDNPVYFVVKPTYGTVTLYTSSSIDWVIEYIDERGVLHMINNEGEINPEKIDIAAKGKPIYVKIYPYKYSVTTEAFLYAENANSVSLSPTIPVPFGTPAGSVPTETPQSALSPFAGLLATGVVSVCGIYGRRDLFTNS
ncbi:MAG: hypothetical protein NTZ39_00180 [Methanoregula sp.]|nr:hypothetical protein [Methanoregula sp.]